MSKSSRSTVRKRSAPAIGVAVVVGAGVVASGSAADRVAGRSAAEAASVASAATRDDTAITIYSSAEAGAIPPELYRPLPGGGVPNGMAVPGYAMVRHDRPIRLEAGRSTLRFSDVAGLIDPTTVTFASLTDPGTRVLEQNFQFDLVSTARLLQRYVDALMRASLQSPVATEALYRVMHMVDSPAGLFRPGGVFQVLRCGLRSWLARPAGGLYESGRYLSHDPDPLAALPGGAGPGR